MTRIERNPEIMMGKPVIKGTRLTVEYVVSLLGQDLSIKDILKEYKGLEREDILACLQYAENVMHETLLFDLPKIVS
jgi:uncharacterized protein (DUF433 family)